MPSMQPLWSTGQYSLGTSSTGVSTGTGTAFATNHARRIQATIIWSSGCSAGTIVVEGADTYDYTGTWQNIDTIAWSAASKVDQRTYDESFNAVRLRITSNIVGGTIKGRLQVFA